MYSRYFFKTQYMIKKIAHFSIIFLLFLSNTIFAQLPENQIITSAKNLIYSNNILKNSKIAENQKITHLTFQDQLVGYVVKLEPQGFIIFSSSKNTYPVFGYSTENNFSYAKNPALSIILDFLYQEKKYIAQTTDTTLIAQNNAAWDKLTKHKSNAPKYDYQYGYWMNDVWGGVNCYDENGGIIYVGNYFTPNHFSPGCVATSTSQILHYYEWPPRGKGTHTDYDNNGASQGSYYAKFEAMEYDWANMLDEYYYKPSTDLQRRAMGRLAYHCAVATDMDFENSGSTANIDRIPAALMSYFRMIGHFETRSWSSFGTRLRSNLRNGHPVILAARADNGDEHAFVCDGYRYNDGEEKYYHLNMGWWNAYGLNGWYRIFNSDFTVGGYNTILSGIFDILPVPYMNEPIYTEDEHTFYVRWQMPHNVNVTQFQVEESFNNGTWNVIGSTADTFFLRTVSQDGHYRYRVKPQIDSIWYADTYSGYVVVPVGNSYYLYFDGDDSFFIPDNIYNNMDIDSTWTIETWCEVDSYTDNGWNVILDRRNVFSLYLLNDYDSDFAIRFVKRDNSDNIVASLRSDSSDVNLQLGQWFHVAVQYDGTTAKLFINGTLVDESTEDFSLASSTNYLNIGARYWGSYSRYLEGRLDEIRISDVARYDNGFCPNRFSKFPKDDNTRLLLHLDTYSGTSIYDATHHFLGISLRSSPNDATWASYSAPIVLSQPKTLSVCSGEQAKFGITAYNANAYQWQISANSTDFSDVTDNAIYSGSITDSLSVNTTTLSGNYTLRCIIRNAKMFSCSDYALFNVWDNCTVWDGSNWSNGTPDNSKSAIIDANYTTNSDLTAQNLLINQNDTLFIMPENSFVTNYIENYGTIALEAELGNKHTGALINSGLLTNYGSMTVKKSIFADNPQIICNITDTALSFASLSNNSLNFLKNTGTPIAWTNVDTSNNFANNTIIATITDSSQIIDFQGITNNENEYTFELQQGWNLLFNPFASPIDWDNENAWQKGDILNSIFFIDPEQNGNSGNYSTYNGTVALVGGSRYINSMQSFWIYANSETELTVYKTAQVTNSTAETFSQDIFANYLKLEFENANAQTDQIAIYFTENQELTPKALPFTESNAYAYLLLNTERYAIAQIAQSEPDTVITAGFKTTTAGNSAIRVIDFDFDIPVVLKDLMTGDTITLNQNTEYQFTATTHEPLNRFRIYFGNYGTQTNEILVNNTLIYSAHNIVYISTKGNAQVDVIDIMGRKIFHSTFFEKTNITNLKSGSYIIVVKTDENVKQQKIIIY